ncbi:hypothetical protein [Nocardia niwae]|uniref:hypothetical protein n=1 Tax=Nocardia niwae TaxID=626084 RepID=UPI0007A56127|nr:hypothetical protein [Nocardia niwae]
MRGVTHATFSPRAARQARPKLLGCAATHYGGKQQPHRVGTVADFQVLDRLPDRLDGVSGQQDAPPPVVGLRGAQDGLVLLGLAPQTQRDEPFEVPVQFTRGGLPDLEIPGRVLDLDRLGVVDLDDKSWSLRVHVLVSAGLEPARSYR